MYMMTKELKMFRSLICLCAVVLLSSCVPLGAGDLPAPRALIVHNLSGVDLDTVALSADKVSSGEAYRYGMVSPVLNGTEQVTERGSSPRPLPQNVALSWTEQGGTEYRRSIDLGPVLLQAQGWPAFALVFEVRPGGELSVLVSAYP
jgi:hypothetical protein